MAGDLGHGNDDVPEWRRTSRSINYLEYTHRKYVLDYSHPEARVSPNLILYGLLDAVREIFGWGEQARAVARSEVARAGR